MNVLLVEGVGFEPTNSEAERIYSPRPLATWIPFRPVGRVYLAVRGSRDKRFPSLLVVRAWKRRKAFTPRQFWLIQGAWRLSLSSSWLMETVLCAIGRLNGSRPAIPVGPWFSLRTPGRLPASSARPPGVIRGRSWLGSARSGWFGRPPLYTCCGAWGAVGDSWPGRSPGRPHFWRTHFMISSPIADIGLAGPRLAHS